jgi:biotin carboxyl carrier protein
MIYQVALDGVQHRVEISQREGVLTITLDGKEVRPDVANPEPDVLSILLGGKSYEIKRLSTPAGTRIIIGDAVFDVEVSDPRSFRQRKRRGGSEEGPQKITSPMPGKVVRVLAPEGTEVEAGQGVIVIEAMKMQNELKSPKKGTVQKIVGKEGAAVNAGDVLAIVE